MAAPWSLFSMSSGSSASKLSTLTGLSGAKSVLSGLFTGQTGVHAVLLYGAEGSGKTTVARVLAQYWLCQNPGPEGACGECQACGAFERGMSGDLLLIEPVGSSSIIRVGAIVTPKVLLPGDPPLAMDAFLRTRPINAIHKVVLMEDADRMNSSSANSLLKTLEEPQPYAKLILTTSSLSRLPATILSRCLAVSCELPKAEEWSAQGLPLEVLELFGGSPGAYQRSQKNADTYRKLWAFAERLPSRPATDVLAASEEFSSLCDELEKPNETNARAANAEGVKMLATFLSASQPDRVRPVIEAHRRILGNANATITFDAMFAEILV